MKKYIAIGHFKGSKNTVSVADITSSKSNFEADLRMNAFVAIAVLTEKTFNEIKAMDSMEIFEKVKKLTTNYRVWNEICDYIEQCMDIMEEKLANAQW
jgi:hypothetical protein